MRWLIELNDRNRIRHVIPHVRGRLLDVGCGRNELVRARGNGIGVDVYPWPYVDRVVEDTRCLPFADSSFDTVSFVACLNHIPERLEVLREAGRVLCDDGRLLATMIPPGVSWVWHHLNRPWDRDQKERGMGPGEVYGLTNRQMTALLEDAGFEVFARERFVFRLNCLYLARKRLN